MCMPLIFSNRILKHLDTNVQIVKVEGKWYNTCAAENVEKCMNGHNDRAVV